jgi:hypothetical protein
VVVSYFDASVKEITGATHHIAAKHTWQAPLDLSFMNPLDANGNPINANGAPRSYSMPSDFY